MLESLRVNIITRWPRGNRNDTSTTHDHEKHLSRATQTRWLCPPRTCYLSLPLVLFTLSPSRAPRHLRGRARVAGVEFTWKGSASACAPPPPPRRPLGSRDGLHTWCCGMRKKNLRWKNMCRESERCWMERAACVLLFAVLADLRAAGKVIRGPLCLFFFADLRNDESEVE